MGFFSRLFRKKEKLPPPDFMAQGLSEVVLHWCSPNEMSRTRTSWQIPKGSPNFESELFYLYIFSILLAIEITFRDNEILGAGIAKSFLDNIHDIEKTLTFPVSSDVMLQRYDTYTELHDHGADEFTRRLPFLFLESIGVNEDDAYMNVMQRDMIQITSMKMLNGIISANQALRKELGL